MRTIGVIVLVAGCGRIAFDPSGDPGDAACAPATITAPHAATACPFACHNPKLVWVGDSYVLCWKQERTIDQSTLADLMCTRLDRDGNQLQAPALVSTNGEPVSMSLTWTGSDLVLSYAANPTGDYEIYVLRMTADFVSTPATRMTAVPGTGWGTSNAWSGSEIGIAFYEDRNAGDPSIYFARLANDGTNRGEVMLTASGFRAFGTSTIWTGNEYVVGWRDIRDGGTWDIYAQRIDASGAPIGDAIRVTDNTQLAADPTLEWTGNAIAVAYSKGPSSDDDEVFVSVLDRTGAPVAPEARLSNAAGTSRAIQLVALPNGELVAAFFDARSGALELFARKLDAQGTPLGADLVVPGSPYFTGGDPNAPAMALSDRGIGAVWPVGDSTNAEIKFVEVCP
jgi:hypothetical protein